jgi:outer membrane murein-binding lipoprotein Lpp
VEVTRLSSQKQTVDARVSKIDSDIEQAAASLNANYLGSTVLAKTRKDGKDG